MMEGVNLLKTRLLLCPGTLSMKKSCCSAHLTMMEGVDLLEDAAPAVPGHLVDEKELLLGLPDNDGRCRSP
jgi:hypothetical protein